MARTGSLAGLELIGRRWTGSIVSAMLDGAKRYGEVRAAIPGIGDRVLTQRLKELEDHEVISRSVVASRPVQILYHLTPKGQAVQEVLRCVSSWAETWPAPEAPESQERDSDTSDLD